MDKDKNNGSLQHVQASGKRGNLCIYEKLN